MDYLRDKVLDEDIQTHLSFYGINTLFPILTIYVPVLRMHETYRLLIRHTVK